MSVYRSLLTEMILNEGKVPETVMTGLDIRFSGNRGKFSNASEKFIAVRDMMVKRTNDKEMQDYIKSVTPGNFFRYKKGNRDMILPENPVTSRYDHQPITAKDRAKSIPFTVDTSGTFKPLPERVFAQHLYPAVIQYYKNTFHNSMPSRELARHIKNAHYSQTDDITMNSVLKSLDGAHTDSTIKRRIDDDTIVEKSVEHFGFKTKEDMEIAIKNDYQYIKDQISRTRQQQSLSNPKSLTHNHFHQDQRDAGLYNPMLIDARTNIVKAYLKRDARALDKHTKEYQLIKFIFKL